MESEIFDKKKYNEIISESLEELSKWPFMGSSIPPICIAVLYLAFVIKIGPEIMKNRSPFKLNTTLIFYNAAQVAYSLYITFWGLKLINRDGVVHKSCRIYYVSKEENLQTFFCGYLYIIAKLSELLDTIFFVLRKKQNQVTFLHVYHHTMMFIVSWLMIKIDPNEIFIFIITLNSAVHVIMYAYYGLAAFPSLKKYLWWKKYITSMQLIQFLAIFVHLLISYVISDCPPSSVSVLFALGNALFFYYLFNRFYKQSYVEPKQEVQKLQNKVYTNGKYNGKFSNGTMKENGNHHNGISNGKYENGTQNGVTNGKYSNRIKNSNSENEYATGVHNGLYDNGNKNGKNNSALINGNGYAKKAT